MGGRSATHVVASSARSPGDRGRLALVDHIAPIGAAECSRSHITAVGCDGTVPFRNAVNSGQANSETHERRACDADAT